MEIAFELFDEITGAGNAARTKDPSDPDRRQHRRLPFGSRGTIAPLRGSEEGPASVVMLRDISVAGIGFLNAEPLKVGETFVIRFTGQNGRIVKFQCTAQRCDPGGTGATQFVIGATFEKLLESIEAPSGPSEGQSSHSPPARATASPAPFFPARKSSLFQTPKLDVAIPEVGTLAMPMPEPAPVSHLATSEAGPMHETVTTVNAVQPTALKAEQPASVDPVPSAQVLTAPVITPTPEITQGVEPVQPPAALTGSDSPAHIQGANTTPISAPASSTAGIDPGKNQELVAQVKSRFLKQHQAMKSQVQQMEEHNRQLADQKAQIEELGRQRDALHAMFVKAGQQLSEEQERSAREIESLRREVLQLRENQQALQAKSESDDRAIAELAALLDSEAGVTVPA